MRPKRLLTSAVSACFAFAARADPDPSDATPPVPHLSAETVAKIKSALPAYQYAARQGRPTAMMALALVYINGQVVPRDTPRGIELLRAAAEAGAVEAMRMLGQFYRNGYAGILRDKTQELAWVRRAAETGDVVAMDRVAHIYHDGGPGVRANPSESARWFKREADAGDSKGINSYGLCLLEGFGVERDTVAGAEWMGKAAALGVPNALMTMAALYMGHALGPPDSARALANIELALKRNTPGGLDDARVVRATTLRDHLRATLPPADIARAQAIEAEMTPGFEAPPPKP